MPLKLPAAEAANVAIQSIGCGYDVSLDLRLKYRKGVDFSDSPNNHNRNHRLIDIDEDEGRDIVLPGGIVIPNVSKSIDCDKGERTRFCSDVLTFQQMSEQFNQEMSLLGKIPSGLFNTMFEFSGSWQKDASCTKTLAFDGVFISLFTVALEKSQLVLSDHVKKAVPSSSWDPALLARFIEKFGTHIIVGVTMGGRDVIYMRQKQASSLQPADVQQKLKAMADKRFLDSDEHVINSEHTSPNDEDLVCICKRRGGSDGRSLKHNEWLQSVQSEPDVITMSFVPITSLLHGLRGVGWLSHAINLYLRYKPPMEQLHQFLEFQLPRQWAPLYSDLPLGPLVRQQSTPSLQFSVFGPKLYVNTSPVDVGTMVTGLRLYLEGARCNRLAIHLQHLSSLPKIIQLQDVNGDFTEESYDYRYYEKVQWKYFSHVCTAPVESENELSIVTGAHLHVGGGEYGLKKVLFLRLRFSTVVGAVAIKNPEWDGLPSQAQKSGLFSSIISDVSSKASPKPADVNINSAVYPDGPPSPGQARKLLKFVDTTEMKRGPEESPGYWVVSGARLVVDRGKILLRVKYSLLAVPLPEEEVEEAF